MPTDRQLEQTISRWLEADAPTQLPDRVLRATFERTRGSKQQGGWQALLRRLQVNRMIFGLAAAAVVVVAVVLGAGLYFNNPGVGTPPSPSPTAEPSPDPTSAPTAAPTATARSTSTPDAGLPVGPFDLVHEGMAMTVMIPSPGWTFEDYSAVLKGGWVGGLPEAGLLLWPFPPGTDFYVPGDPCRVTSTRPDTPATTVDELVAALTAQPSRDASEPVDVTIGGYAGKSFILHVPEDAVFDDCEQTSYVSFGALGENDFRGHQGPTQIDEFWILDVDGSIAILDAAYRPETPAELVDELRSIAESATFGTP